jgi:hypothetical protein
MAVRLQFEGIRCFSEPQDAVIRPITPLVGENSSGKTTFLALCRIAHAINNGSVGNPPFNSDPFWLGAYDQIASNRGGSRGRAKSFSIAIHIDNVLGRCSLRAEYKSHSGQPWPRTWRLEAGVLAIEVSNDQPSHAVLTLEGPLGKTSVPCPGFDFDLVAFRADQWVNQRVRRAGSLSG